MDKWKVGEYWSSANPGTKVLLLSVGAHQILSGEAHPHFIRWVGQSQAIPQWIACSERMPGDKQRVLVWDGEQLAIAVRFSGPPAFWGFNAFDFTEVTHWMPLPAAPTPQGGNHD